MAVTLYALLQIEPAGGLTEALSQSPLLALAVLFGAGVLTSLTPCVYPMIPITASVLAGSAEQGAPRSKVVGLTFTYALGLALLYATLGLVAGLSGSLFGTVSASPWTRLAIGNRVLVFGLALSIALMAVAASYLARALDRHRWIAFLGLAVILYVALSMIVDGAREVLSVLAARV